MPFPDRSVCDRDMSRPFHATQTLCKVEMTHSCISCISREMVYVSRDDDDDFIDVGTSLHLMNTHVFRDIVFRDIVCLLRIVQRRNGALTWLIPQ